MDELENAGILNAEQEAPQDAQEAPVTAETDTGREIPILEAEAPQEATESPETGTEKEDTKETPQEAAEDTGTGTEEEAAESPEADTTGETAEDTPRESEEAAADAVQPETPPEEAPQDAQEAPVTAETDTGREIPILEAEAPQEATESPGTDTQETPAAEEPGQQIDVGSKPILGSGQLGKGDGQAVPAVVTPSPVLMATASATETEDQETDEEYDTLDVNGLDVVKLGRQGEHLTQQVLIDCTAWLDKLPGCTLLIAAIRPGENAVYLPTVSVSAGVITWNVRDQDTANGGWGRGEVRAMKDGKIKKSAVFRTRVEPSLEGDSSTPATPPDWVQTILDSVTKAAADAASAASSAATAAAKATSAAAAASEAATNTAGLRGWSLTKEADDTVSIDYKESEG